MATEQIKIVVSENGSRVVKRNIEDIGTGAEKSASSVNSLQKALAGLGIGLSVVEIIKLADTYTNLQNRLRLVTDGTAGLNAVTKELFTISNQTRSSYEATAELYARTALALKDMGVSARTTLNFTKSLNQAVILSGASATEAQAGIIQLSQGMASGALRGDELRSVLEQLPAVADVIAKGLGVTRGQLRLMGSEGKITTQIIIDAFAKASGELDKNFNTTVATVGQSMVVLKNHVIELIGTWDSASGSSHTLAQAIITLSDNLDILAKVLLVISGTAIIKFISGFASARIAMLATASTVTTVSAAHTAGMLGIATSITRVIPWYARLGTMVAILGRGLLALVGGPIGIFVAALVGLVSYLGGVDASIVRLQQGILFLGAGFAKVGNTIIGFFSGVIAGLTSMGERISDIFSSIGEGMSNFINHPFADNNFSALDAELEKGFVGGFKDAYAKVMDETKAFNKEIDKSLATEIDKLNSRLKPKPTETVDLNTKGTASPIAGAPDKDFLKEQKRVMDEILKPMRDYANAQIILNAALDSGKITTAQFNEEMAKVELRFLNSKTKTGFADGFTSQLRIMQLETRSAVADMGAEFGKIFGPGGTLVKGIGDAVAQSIVFGKSFKQSIGDISREILSKLISALIQVGVNMLINFALGETLKATSTATSVAAAATTAAAWSPAAAMTSLASFGSNSIGAIAAIGATMAASISAIAGFEEGGYTGGGGRSQIAGVVHGQEFVVNAGATSRNRAALEAMNAGRQTSTSAGGVNVNIINQAPGVEFETRQLGERDVEIIARRVVRQEAPGVIAGDISNPNSKTSKSLSQNTDTSRRRT